MALLEQISLAINLAALPAALFCVVITILLYRLIQSPAIGWLIATTIYGLAIRVVAVLEERNIIDMPVKYLGAGVYILLGIAVWQLYRMLKTMLAGNGNGDSYRGKDRRKHG